MIVTEANFDYDESLSTSDDLDTRTKSDARVEVEMSSSSGCAAVSGEKMPLTTTSGSSFATMATDAEKNAISTADCSDAKCWKFMIPKNQITNRRRGQKHVLSSDCSSAPLKHDSSSSNGISSKDRSCAAWQDRCCRRRSPNSNLANMNLFRGAFVFFVLISTFNYIPVAGATKKWTIEELMTLRFPYQTSNDLYMDVCKAGKR